MKKILIIGMNFDNSNAVSNIMKSIITSSDEKLQITCIDFSSKTYTSKSPNGIINITFKNPYENLIYKILRHIAIRLKLEDYPITSLYLDLKMKKTILDNNFDVVYGISGLFAFTYSAYKYSKQNNLPLRIINFDPFANGTLARKVKQRRRVEEACLKYADIMYYNADNIAPNYKQYKEKLKPFYIPIPTYDTSDNHVADYLVYGGIFYQSIRNPILLYNFVKENIDSLNEVFCYSNIIDEMKIPNLKMLPLLPQEEFIKKCKNAKALIYIGNKNANSKSSKYLEYIALKKPIIGINVEKDNEVRKYPFYFDESQKNLMEKINSINNKSIIDFEPLTIYPHRNPKSIFNELFKL